MGNLVPERGSRKEDGYAAALLLDRLRSEIRLAVNRGRHYLDAARDAGVSEQLAIAIKDDCEELRELYEISKTRTRQNWQYGNPAEALKPVEIKHRYLQDLAEAGLFSKSVEMVRQAEPTDEVGARVIEGHLRYVAKELWPKEAETKTQTKDDDQVLGEMSLEQLEEAIRNRRSKRITAQKKIVDVQRVIEERNSGRGG